MRILLLRWFATLAGMSLPAFTSAHEIYVLTPEQAGQQLPPSTFDLLTVAQDNVGIFLFSVIIGTVVVALVFYAEHYHSLKRVLTRLSRYTTPIIRITIGLSFLAGAYYQASYGPEFPLQATYGAWSGLITFTLLIIGFLIIIGWYTRLAATIGLVLYFISVYYHGAYMLTYVNYFGGLVFLLMLTTSSIPIVRICFGVALIYSAFYAKVLHNGLALFVVSFPIAGHATSLSQLFGIEAHLLVLGAAIIEMSIGLFFILGFEIRFASFFLLCFVFLSLWYFGEVVWPHLILIGIPIAFICYGSDDYSLETWLTKKLTD